jgi:hypothetical protein
VEEPGDTDFLVGEQVAKTILPGAISHHAGKRLRVESHLVGLLSLSEHRKLHFGSILQETTRVRPSGCGD